ncbi:hypothetical protein H8704_13335 [Lachnospiraceae bacterium NSJ-37]|uniref:DNA2/NAM7 helicase helicase domain-containing protein n=2 Tax=Jutongia huaianensis TaxID=2763668 RepID=A0ABR7N4P3_9FIRM|nr:hypothetical protein [Jutongia huaianensis]
MTYFVILYLYNGVYNNEIDFVEEYIKEELPMMSVNVKQCHKCAFCKHWYDPTNSHIQPKSPRINLWQYDHTVIAEAIYQFVKRGDRVLVASQSNDAVDNALERLADSPEIRAIRLGQKGKRKRKAQDLSTRKFGEDEALKYYYHALSLQLSKNWLDLWDSLEGNGVQYDTDIRDASLFNNDIAELNKDLAGLHEQYAEARDRLDSLNKEFETANDKNTKLEEDKLQYRFAVDSFKGKTDSQFYLPADMLKIFESNLNGLIESTLKSGIYLIPEILDSNVMALNKEQAYVSLVPEKLKTLKCLSEKLKNVQGKDKSNDAKHC